MAQVVIGEYGSQYTLVISRRLRELGVRSQIVEPRKLADYLAVNQVKAVILSGSYASVYNEKSPKPPVELLSQTAIPVLGICYGMQAMAHHFGGRVEPVDGKRDYGPAQIQVLGPSRLFDSTPTLQKVWASHGDSVVSLPEGFEALAETESGGLAAMVNRERNLWGVQFHPEVDDTPYGESILRNFLEIAGCERDWQSPDIVSGIRERTISELNGGKAVMGFSGGVDSTTNTGIVAPVLNNNLLLVTLDGNNLRQDEPAEISRNALFAGAAAHMTIEAHHEFQEALTGLIDAEEKRKAFQRVYASLLAQAAKHFGAKYIIQGTLATDRIESGATGGDKIKTHHNVGINWEEQGLTPIHPLDFLFKYEVRDLARTIGLPESVWNREPFPGPGLFIRVLATPPTPDKLELVRWADAEVRKIVIRHEIELSQLVVAYHGFPTVGIKGDERSYHGSILVRGVRTLDFMTAKGVYFPEAAVEEMKQVLTQHPQVVRVWFDPTDKPSGTTEFQ